jgi:hypothetical protein
VIHFLFTAWFGLVFLAGPIFCAESCDWINSATASGILGGPAESVVTHPAKNKADGTCVFTRRNGPVTSVIRIDVITGAAFEGYLAQCGSQRTRIRDLGNEAVACAGHRHGRSESEQVIGRVRDRTFVVRVESSAKSPVSSSLREQARSVAAQVAGNLF